MGVFEKRLREMVEEDYRKVWPDESKEEVKDAVDLRMTSLAEFVLDKWREIL